MNRQQTPLCPSKDILCCVTKHNGWNKEIPRDCVLWSGVDEHFLMRNIKSGFCVGTCCSVVLKYSNHIFFSLELDQVAILKQIKPILNTFELSTPKAEKRRKSIKEHAKRNRKRQIKRIENTVSGITQNCCSSQLVLLK